MRPAVLEGSSPNYRILLVCETCGFERVNKLQPEDSTDAMVELAAHPHPPTGQSIHALTGEQFDPLANERSYPESNMGDMESNIG